MPNIIKNSYVFNNITIPLMDNPKTPVVELSNTLTREKGLQLFLKRDDLIHPAISGNKWRKLKYNLIEAQRLGMDKILTFGGAFSNHIYATAAASKACNLQSIGLIRGEYSRLDNPTLTFAKEMGMVLHRVAKKDYQNKEALIEKFADDKTYVIPEGGSNLHALRGVAEMVEETIAQLEREAITWVTSVGTGGTMTGIIAGAAGRGEVLGFSSLKGNFLAAEVKKIIQLAELDFSNWTVNNAFHFGGYAKYDEHLIDFINQFKSEYEIQLEPLYNGKMMYGLFELIREDYFKRGTTIVAIHTGGLQGIRGFNLVHGPLIQE